MTLQETFNALDTYIRNHWTATAIEADNYEFETETTTPYIWPLFLPDTVEEGEIAGSNGNGASIRYGFYLINVYRPKNEGLSTILGYASTLEALFYYKDIDSVFTERPFTRRMGVEDNFYRLAVSVPWWAWISE